MHLDSKKLLNLMFNPGESVCVSPNKWGYHSVALELALSDKIALVSPNAYPTQEVSTDKLLLCALNPINGFRRDENSIAFRNYLIELDVGTENEQLEYVKSYEIPYSACVFSGSKSLHFLVSLDQDLPNEKTYRYLAEWFLNILTLADQNCKNPSRSIRLPGAEREPGKFQILREFRGKVSLKEFVGWLSKHPNAKPRPQAQRHVTQNGFDVSKVGAWVLYRLNNGLNLSKGRNKEWFSFACELALAGFNLEDTEAFLGKYYVEEKSFPEKEWRLAISQGFNHAFKK